MRFPGALDHITDFMQLKHTICAILPSAVDTLYVIYWYHYVILFLYALYLPS